MAERVGRQLGDRDNAHAEKVTTFCLFFLIVMVFNIVDVTTIFATVILVIIIVVFTTIIWLSAS